jgi:ferredoxin
MSPTVTKKLMLFFPQCECEKPIIYHLVKDHNLIVNIYRAKVTPEEEGYLVLDVTGTDEDIQKGMEFVRTFNVSINYTGKGVIVDDKLCTHCGHCVTFCPTDALHIPDMSTREVVYTESKCIECMACIRVCPYGACTSAF